MLYIIHHHHHQVLNVLYIFSLSYIHFFVYTSKVLQFPYQNRQQLDLLSQPFVIVIIGEEEALLLLPPQ